MVELSECFQNVDSASVPDSSSDTGEDTHENDDLSSSPLKRKQDNKEHSDAKKLKKDKSKFKQPTPEELNNFREVENLYNSFILKSELEDLLKSNTFKDTKYTAKCNKFDKWLNELVTALKKITEYENVKPEEFIKGKDKYNKKMRSVQILFNKTFEFTEDYTLCDGNTISSFVRPESVHAFGGFKSGACLKTDFFPNVLVKMPRSAFYDKDFLNNRYLVKRFHYLLYILYELKDKPFITHIEVDNYKNNELLKILRITPSFDSNARIQLFVAPEQDTFKPSRMEPTQNNFKINVFQNIDLTFSKFSGKLFKTMDIRNYITRPTANYNTHLLHDFTLEENNKHIEMTLQEHPCCQDAIKLLLLWLKKRQLNTNFTAFTNELLIYTIIYLVQKKKINKHMSSYQVARIFFIFINDTDWRAKPISLSAVTDFGAFTENFDVVFTDYSGYYNLAGFLDDTVYEKLKFEAAMALEILNKDVFRAFMSLFKSNMSMVLQYDCIVYFNDLDCFQTLFEQYSSDDMKWKYFGCYEQLITKQIMELLKYGLGDRIQYIIPLHLKTKNSPNTKKIVNATQGPLQRVVFGLKLNPSKALNPLIIGPQQYDPEAAKFKEFWGDLVSLRRFANTSIHEAVFFDKAKTVADKRNICAQIIEFVANKINVSYEIVSNQFEDVVKLPNMVMPFAYGTNEEATKLVQVATDELFKKIRELNLENATIQTLACVSDVFCGTDPFPPVASNYHSGKRLTTVRGNGILLREHKNTTVLPRYVPIIECIMQINLLDKSALDSLIVYNGALSTIYNDLAVALTTTPVSTVTLAKSYMKYIDVLYKGLVYRLRAFNDREVALRKRVKDDSGQVAYRSNVDSVLVERVGVVEPAVYGALNGLYKQYPCYGTATAIAKRWLRSQLLHQLHINDMTINLLMAAVFLTPEPFDRPTLPQLAFLQFLRFLAEFPFDQLPVVLNFHGELGKEDIARVESDFVEKRDHYNAVHILMIYDQERSLFTTKSPDNMIIRRLKNMATDSLLSINECINEQEKIFPEYFFVPNMEGYDIIIQLYSTLNPKRHLKVLQKTDKPITINEYNENEETKLPIVAYSPVDIYLNKLEEQFGSFAYFFHDIYGGNFIAVLWNTKVHAAKEFKISNVAGRNLINDELTFDFDATLQDFITLGGGLVKDVIENNTVNT